VSGRSHVVGWVVMGVVVVVALTVGVVQGREPRTLQHRVDAIAKTIRCPVCDSESVYESRTAAAEDIRRQIAIQVQDGRRADEIRASISASYDQDLLLTPPSDGIAGLVWVLPIVAVALAAAGLVVAFRRWHTRVSEPTDADRELVAKARAGGGP
jgi:cytochrome c-type biogenesis protein CcmH